MKRGNQKGYGLIGWMVILALIGFFILVITKTLPLYLNQMKVARSVKMVANEGTNFDLEPAQMHRELEARWDVEDIQILQFRQIKIKQMAGGKRVLAYDYEARANLFYNIYLVIHFKDDVPLRRMSN